MMDYADLREYFTVDELSAATEHPPGEIRHWIATGKLLAKAKLHKVLCGGFVLPNSKSPIVVRRLSGYRGLRWPNLDSFFAGREVKLFLDPTEFEKKELRGISYWCASSADVNNIEIIITSAAFTAFKSEFMPEEKGIERGVAEFGTEVEAGQKDEGSDTFLKRCNCLKAWLKSKKIPENDWNPLDPKHGWTKLNAIYQELIKYPEFNSESAHAQPIKFSTFDRKFWSEQDICKLPDNSSKGDL